ncbi:putative membrane protein [Neisseria meningitidis NM3230]|nr:putative membrane protein [Neisseria meningitidis NM3230]
MLNIKILYQGKVRLLISPMIIGDYLYLITYQILPPK